MPAKPDYRRIIDDVRQKIETGEWPPGAKLPTKRELAAEYGVSLGTVDRALIELAAQGLTVGRQGKGVFVCGDGD